MGPNATRTDRSGMLRRLGYYLCGLAIGFVLLGVFQTMRGPRGGPAPAGVPTAAPAETGTTNTADPGEPGVVDADEDDGG